MPEPTRVLVVEDDPKNQLATAQLLRSLGCRVDCVGDGTEAVAAAASTRYDLVLIDIVMPNMNGLEAARQIRAHDPGVVVVALTSYDTAASRIACADAGMAAVLSKPVDAVELKKLIPPAPSP